jgi:hypothetical protein
VLQYAPDSIAQQPKFYQLAIAASPWEVVAVQNVVTRQELLHAVERQPHIYPLLTHYHKADYELARAAVSRNPRLFLNAPKELESDPRLLQLL